MHFQQPEKSISASAEHRMGQLKAILYLLQTNLEEYREEVDRSYELIKIGERTDLSKQIELALENPLESVFGIYSNVDSSVRQLVDRLVVSYLRHYGVLIDAVIRTANNVSGLHYCISLKEDNTETRRKILGFHDKYDLWEISERFPVVFQFMPAELIEKVGKGERVELAA